MRFRGAELLTGNTLGLLLKRPMMLGKQTGLSKPNMLGLHRAHQYNDFFFFNFRAGIRCQCLKTK